MKIFKTFQIGLTADFRNKNVKSDRSPHFGRKAFKKTDIGYFTKTGQSRITELADSSVGSESWSPEVNHGPRKC